jgi:SAM-dependent methyltransferase
MKSSKELKEIVKDKYGQIARDSYCSCCCGDNDDQAFSVFTDNYEHLEGYNEDADLSLGCGIPTEYAEINPGDHLLDLGSGAGNDCFVARSIVGEKGKVTGLDFTDEMIMKAKANNMAMGFKNVDFIKGDIEDMSLPDASYDVVISNCVLNLVPDKEKAFSEIKRVLKSGGHFCVSDIVLKGDLPDELREVAALYAGCVSGALKKEEYLDTIHKAGFTGVEVRKEKQIHIPDSLYLEHLSQESFDELKKRAFGIYSITVFGVR